MTPLYCPFCGWGEDHKVKDRRGIWRRRQCGNPECDSRFSTREIVVGSSVPRHHPPSRQLHLFA